jgi:hypothetical protein
MLPSLAMNSWGSSNPPVLASQETEITGAHPHNQLMYIAFITIYFHVSWITATGSMAGSYS